MSLTTQKLTGTINTSIPGYHLVEYRAYGSGYNFTFGIIVKVGNPPSIIITTPQQSIIYEYSNTAWKDQLSSYEVISNGVSKESSILYDEQGNPVTITNFYYNGTKYTFSNLLYEGRTLVKVVIKNVSTTIETIATISYIYNNEGYRIKKIIEETGSIQEITYKLIGDKVIYETDGTYEIINYYDVDGTIISFYHDEDINDQEIGKDYYYLKNIFGDITELVDNEGRIVVEYRYDAYGNMISIKEYNQQNLLTALNIALINQYRYRSYRYDTEVNLYYLNSRYYNPETARFINADGIIGQIGNIQSSNMFAYCYNNPVMYTDSTGMSPFWDSVGNWFEDHWVEIAIGTAFILVGAVVTALTCGTGLGFIAAFGSALATSMTQVGFSMAISVGIGGLISVSRGDGFFANVGDNLASGFMLGGIFAGGAQILSGGFKFAAQHGFKGVGQFLSPDRLRGATEIAKIAGKGQAIYNTGGRLASFGFGAIDVGTKSLLHMHLWFTATHIPLGTILGGVIGGF